MSIISTAELTRHAQVALTDRTFEAILLNRSIRYSAETPYATLIADEVSSNAGGYSRIEFSFNQADIIPTSTGANTASKYLTWFHDGNQNPINFDHILVVEKTFAQPLPIYSVVSIYDLGFAYSLRLYGERARFALRFNIKNK